MTKRETRTEICAQLVNWHGSQSTTRQQILGHVQVAA